MKILIFGLPGRGKTTLAKSILKKIEAVHVNADEVRERYDDWDFTIEGRTRQAYRMNYLSDGIVMAGKIAIADFICPTEATRKEFNADLRIWMDTIDKGRYEDTNKLFEKPLEVDLKITEWSSDNNEKLLKLIKENI